MPDSNMFAPGDYAYLAHEVIEHATGDHPEFLMGVRGEKVLILDVSDKEFPIGFLP